MLLPRRCGAGKSEVGTLVHDDCQARQLEGEQGNGREGPRGRVGFEEVTMTRKTRNGERSVVVSRAVVWCGRGRGL